MSITAALADAYDGMILVPRVVVVPRWSAASVRGLLGVDGLAVGEGLLLGDLLGCLHTAGMRFAIDVVFLDRRLRVLRVVSHVAPGRLVLRPGATRQLELAAGVAARIGLRPGRHLRLVPRGASAPTQGLQRAERGTAIGEISTAWSGNRSAGARSAHPGLALPRVTGLRWRRGPDEGPPPGADRRHRRIHHREGVRRWAPTCS